uniref:Leucine rich adaptor protein 1-like n=1 Tax=Fundulus heteroclitus TaxID=8078 RepID=A0A3Q2PK89_FUNHE
MTLRTRSSSSTAGDRYNLCSGMPEDVFGDFCPDLIELENKIGRKTPESLLVWMKDGADGTGGWDSDALDRQERGSDGLSDKINNLKQEMRRLRCADVRILRQLVAVHEGIETMRWLIDDRGLLTSRSSSLTDSLSSLPPVEEHVPSASPCRADQSPAFPEDIRITADEKAADQQPPHAEASEPRPVCPSKVEDYSQAPLSAASSLVSADVAKSQTPEPNSARLHIRNGAETIRRALLRSCKRKQTKANSGPAAARRDAGEKNSVHLTQGNSALITSDDTKREEEEESSAGGEKELLGYDLQWSWVDSKDDVTFL